MTVFALCPWDTFAKAEVSGSSRERRAGAPECADVAEEGGVKVVVR